MLLAIHDDPRWIPDVDLTMIIRSTMHGFERGTVRGEEMLSEAEFESFEFQAVRELFSWIDTSGKTLRLIFIEFHLCIDFLFTAPLYTVSLPCKLYVSRTQTRATKWCDLTSPTSPIALKCHTHESLALLATALVHQSRCHHLLCQEATRISANLS